MSTVIIYPEIDSRYLKPRKIKVEDIPYYLDLGYVLKQNDDTYKWSKELYEKKKKMDDISLKDFAFLLNVDEDNITDEMIKEYIEHEIYSEKFLNIKYEMESIGEEFNLKTSFHPGYPGIQYVTKLYRDNFEHNELKKFKYDYINLIRYDDGRTNFFKDILFDDVYKNLYIYSSTNTLPTTDDKKNIKKEVIDYMGKVYKIHLQVKARFQLDILRIILKYVKSDRTFKNYVSVIKTIIPYSRVLGDDRIPSIVIYITLSPDSKQFTKYVLLKLFYIFKNIDHDVVGLNLRPRFNHKLTPMIYFANGNGNDKKEAIERGIADELFSPTPTDFEEMDGYFHYNCENNSCHLDI